MTTAGIEQMAVNVRTASKAINVSVTTGWNLVWQGKLRCVKVGKRTLIPVWAIEEYLRENVSPKQTPREG